MPPDPPSLVLLMQIRHLCNPPSKNPGYGPGEADDLFSFMVRLSGCMCGGRQCLCVGNIMFLAAGEVRNNKS